MHTKAVKNIGRGGRKLAVSEYFNYLEKEGKGGFFSKDSGDISRKEAGNIIGINDDYFSFIVSPSKKELAHLDKKGFEKDRFMREFAKDVVEEYTYHFNLSQKKHFGYNKSTGEYIINNKHNKNNAEEFIENLKSKKTPTIIVCDHKGADFRVNDIVAVRKTIEEYEKNGIPKESIKIVFVQDEYTKDSKPLLYPIQGVKQENYYLNTNVSNIKEHGFFLNKNYYKPKLKATDVEWVAKIEKSRTYKSEDINVQKNEALKKDMEILQSLPQGAEKEQMAVYISKQYKKGYVHEKKDGTIYYDYNINKKELIQEGKEKAGDQTHVHIIIKDEVTTLKGEKIKHNPFQYFPLKKNAQAVEHIFDLKSGYDRQLAESINHRMNHRDYASILQQKHEARTGLEKMGLIHLEKYANIMAMKTLKANLQIQEKKYMRNNDVAGVMKTKKAIDSVDRSIKRAEKYLSEQNTGYSSFKAGNIIRRAVSPIFSVSPIIGRLLSSNISITQIAQEQMKSIYQKIV